MTRLLTPLRFVLAILAAVDLRDILFLAGVVLIAVGLSLVSTPAALIVPGAILVLVATVPYVLAARPPSGGDS